jgi:PAS domain S-box-containing protein
MLVSCVVGTALGVLGLAGHALHIALFYRVIADRPQMQPLTAVLLTVAGLGIGLQRAPAQSRARRLVCALLGGVLVLAAAAVAGDYLLATGWLSALSRSSELGGPTAVGLPSPYTSFALGALGLAILVFDVELPGKIIPREWLCLAAVFIAFVSLVGHAFGTDPIYQFGDSRVIGVALPTGLALSALGIAGLLARPQRGLARLLLAPGPGGVMLRRFGLIAVLGGPLLGAGVLALVESLGIGDLALILALANVAVVFLALILLGFTARAVERAYDDVQAERIRTRELFELAPEGIFIADLQGRYTDVNTAGCRLLGYPRDEIVGKTIVDLRRPEDVQRLWDSLEVQLAGVVELGEWKLRRKDGSLVSTEVTAKVLPDGRWQAFVRDISERVELERALLESRDDLRHRLVEQEFLARVDVELASCLEYEETLSRLTQLVTGFLGDISSLDVIENGLLRRATVLHRLTQGAGVARSVQQVGPVRGPDQPLTRVIETREPLLLSHITREQRKQYATSPEHARVLDEVDATSAMLIPLIAHGELLAVLSIAACHGARSYGRDDMRLAQAVADRAALRLENVLLLQQARLQAVMTENLAEGVALVRHADATILYTNQKFATMFGYEPSELVGLPISVLEAPTSTPQSDQQASIVEELSHTGFWHGELQSIRKNGSVFWCAVSASLYEHERYGKLRISVRSDITERRMLEQRNAAALRDKEVLLREIHHRVKNNLQVISSLFALQRERTENEQLKMLLDESQTRLQSIALVHEQLYRSADLAVIDLDDYLRSLVSAVRSSYGAERVTIETSAKGVVLDVEQAVPCALLTCELVSNAIRHAFPNGVGNVWVHAARDEQGDCVLEVSDDGCGIALDFDWKQARSLGLRLVRALARQLRGTLELDRSHGTRFIVRFPLSAEQAAEPMLHA